ncbi:hypothetical protein N7516_008917 [Penicillium verrucosum]|uniref:uncharacterized protein n=1 Tax=Penicillium verrucosum TaxID=60171 RepID=UPI0025454934|nr:uncharacterized protein N7516_008917 [Penicillium verrucosum]KAJ5927144.1 hypothetical protein N7516_008917 [Penicillium verrucosum]
MSSSEATLGDLANEVAYQKLQYFVGCAIIELRHLKFESLDMMGVREFDKKNFQRILNIFEIEGCANLEPEHRIAATIDQETLKNGLVYTNISQETLLNPTSRLPLRFNNSQQLICLYGQHRLRAGEAHGETEWLVDLYLDERVGFCSDQISNLRQDTSEDKISQDFFRSFCREEFYQVEKGPLDTGARRLRHIWRALAKPEDKTGSDPEYTTDNSDAAADHRFNCSRPVQYQQERRHLFLDQIYSIDQPRKQYVTSLAITRDIIFSFFGKSPLYEAITNQGVHPPNESNGTLLPRTEISGLPREDNLNTHDPSLADNQSMTGEQSSGLDTHMHETQDIPSDQVVDNDQDMGTEQALVDQAQNVDLDQRILAEGFEDEPQPMFCEGQISVHRSFKEMLMLWFASNNNSLVVLYLFETRTLYKFPLPGNFLLRSTLSNLARTHYFLMINEYGFNVADPGKEFEEAVKRQLLFVGKRDHLGPSDCDVSSDALRDYITRYDVKTGKRYGGEIETQPATKRQEKRTS